MKTWIVCMILLSACVVAAALVVCLAVFFSRGWMAISASYLLLAFTLSCWLYVARDYRIAKDMG